MRDARAERRCRAHRSRCRPLGRSRRRACAADFRARSAAMLENGSTNGLCTTLPARSPSTIAASERLAVVLGEVGGARVAAAAAAGGDEHDRAARLALGEDARELEQGGGARELRRRARLGGVAMGDDHDRAHAGGAGRSAMTVVSVRVPSIVAAWIWRVLTWKPRQPRPRMCPRWIRRRPACSGQTRSYRRRCPIRAAARRCRWQVRCRLRCRVGGRESAWRAPADPAKARGPLNASGASVEPSGEACPDSENPAITRTNSSGTNAAR